MLKRILVPLDGSARAEQALPLAARIAQASGGSIVLLRVVNTLSYYGLYATEPVVMLEDTLHEEHTKAASYLARLAASTFLAGIDTHVSVFSGNPAEQILHVAQEEQIDLIVMCSHGYTGLTRWMLGSVAQKVAWHSTVPALILREEHPRLSSLSPEVGHPIRALVALDETLYSEAALLPAAQLVAACSAPARGELHLTHLVQLPTIEEEMAYERLGLDTDLRKAALYQAGNHLQAIRGRLLQELPASSEVDISWSVEECKDVADALLKVAQGIGMGTHAPSDLIAITTHGRMGPERWVRGSVAERVLNHTTMPLLIVHPHKSKASPAALSSESEEIVFSRG